MGFFDEVGKVASNIGNAITNNPITRAGEGLFRQIGGETKKVLHITPTNAQKRANEETNRQISDQIGAYKEQTELTRNQLNEARASQETEQRRIQEKQIRALRRSSRAAGAGMLGVGQPATQDIGTKLGG